MAEPPTTPFPHRFVLTVQEICKAPNERHKYIPPHSVWYPPRFNGGNILLQGASGYHNLRAYSFDGQTLLPTSLDWLEDQKNAHPPRVLPEPARTTSAYHEGGRFWLVDHDATALYSSANEVDDLMAWTSLHFRWPPELDEAGRDSFHGYSTAIIEESHHDTLYAQRRDQTWHNKLLPQGYFRTNRDWRAVDYPPPFGSLNGDLSLLIALLAFSADPNGQHVEDTLVNSIIGGSWRDPIRPQGDGWYNRRGVLVNVYLPVEYNAEGWPMARWTDDTLTAYENTIIFA